MKLSVNVPQQSASNARIFQLVLLVLCSFAVNANTVFNGFVYDDTFQIVNNSWITNISHIPDIFLHDANHVQSMGTTNYYRPLMDMIYMLNYYVFSGVKAWGFHLVNVLFHVGVTLMVFSVSAILFHGSESPHAQSFFSAPLLSALIFAVHPVHSEVVAWAACIPELSFTLFCLLSFYFNLKSQSHWDHAYLWSLAFFGLAIFCKETAVMLLPILAIYDRMNCREKYDVRRHIVKYAPYIVIVGCYFALRMNALGSLAPANRHPELSTYEVIINSLPLFSQYLGKLLLPVNLSVYHILHPIHTIADPRWLFSLAVVLAFMALSYVLFKRNKTAFLGLMIIAIPLLPVFYIRGLGENAFAERYLYFPSIGFALTAGSLYHRICTPRWRTPITTVLVMLLGAYAIGSINRNQIWHDELSLWTDALQKSPDSGTLHVSVGIAQANMGNPDAAIQEFQQALSINPDDFNAHYSLGNSLAKKGDMDSAIKEMRWALRLKPDYYAAHFNLGNFLASKGDLDGAVNEFRTTLALNPNLSLAHNNLGIALARKGDLDAAAREFQEALAINPNFADARHNLEITGANRR